MSNPETVLKARILLACGALPGVRLFNSPTGQAWQGKVVSRDNDTITLLCPRQVRYGRADGEPDIIGWRSRNGIAQLVGLEVKTKTGTLSDDQKRFLGALQPAGAIVGVPRSPEEAMEALVG